ncbi:MAG: polyphosphate kinase 2 family protein [Acidobacteriota bacterium]
MKAIIDTDRYRVRPGHKIELERWPTADGDRFKPGKKGAGAVLDGLTAKLEALQELLYAEGKHRFLVVLQGMDTAGKDGTIRHVFEGVNPQGVRVASFKVPTPPELGHDFLWRVHAHAPGNGEMVIFNRSHYEDVLVVRVHGLVPEDVWKQRYRQIAEFERLLVESGTTVLKFFLHISKAEQKRRLEERRDDPSKHWKFNRGDLKERELWGEYHRAYEDALEKTSTDWAPWYVVPADHKWYRNLVIGSVLVRSLEGLGMKLPSGPPGISRLRIA